MLLVLKPLALILLAVGKLVGSPTLTLTFYIFTLMVITVGIVSLSCSVRLSLEHFTLILATIREGVVANPYLLCMKTESREAEDCIYNEK